jgi:alcohol dehydrogenase
VHYAICHVLGASAGVSHGDANCVMLPEVAFFNGEKELAAAMRELRETIQVPTRLRDLGVKREALAGVAAQVMHERGVYFNPRPVRGAGEALELLERSW